MLETRGGGGEMVGCIFVYVKCRVCVCVCAAINMRTIQMRKLIGKVSVRGVGRNGARVGNGRLSALACVHLTLHCTYTCAHTRIKVDIRSFVQGINMLLTAQIISSSLLCFVLYVMRMFGLNFDQYMDDSQTQNRVILEACLPYARPLSEPV